MNPSLYQKMPFDVEKDFIPVTKAGGSPNSWLVNPSFPAKTMKELIDLIKKEPGKHSVGSPGAGTTPSLSIEMLRLGLGLDFVTVPFAGGGPMTTVAARRPHADRLRRDRQLDEPDQGGQDPRARASPPRSAWRRCRTSRRWTRSASRDQEAETMTGVFVPAGTPKAIVDLLQKEISEIVNTPDIKARLLELGVVPEGNSPAVVRGLRQGRHRQVEEGHRGRQDPENLIS